MDPSSERRRRECFRSECGDSGRDLELCEFEEGVGGGGGGVWWYREVGGIPAICTKTLKIGGCETWPNVFTNLNH